MVCCSLFIFPQNRAVLETILMLKLIFITNYINILGLPLRMCTMTLLIFNYKTLCIYTLFSLIIGS